MSLLLSKRLSHLHIVQLVGSYTDPRFVGILMTPVADCYLKEYLDSGPISGQPLLPTFFGCLAAAVCYLHDSRIRHKDIKPQNVLIKDHHVYLTDFGISRDWTELGRSTTSGPTIKTPRYCAPEVAVYGPRNTSSDIWSLGCVFLEIWTVLNGKTLASLISYLENQGKKSSCYHLNILGVDSWCTQLNIKPLPMKANLGAPLDWIKNMMQISQDTRWTARILVDRIQEETARSPIAYTGFCCNDTVDSPESVESSVLGDDVDVLRNACHFRNLHIQIPPRQLITKTSDTERKSETESDDIVKSNQPENRSIARIVSSSTGDNNPEDFGLTPRSRKRFKTAENSDPIPERKEKLRKLGPTVVMWAPPTVSSVQSSLKVFKLEQSIVHTKLSEPLQRPAPFILETDNKKLPKSMVIAMKNRFTHEQILQLTSNVELPGRSTRSLSSRELPLFFYGDCMFPAIIYAETKSVISSDASCRTLLSIATNMTPAILRGYTRYRCDEDAFYTVGPTICFTNSVEDMVRGMVVFSMHDPQRRRMHQYMCGIEEPRKELVQIELRDGQTLEQEVLVYVWNQDLAMLTSYNRDWQPIELLGNEWYEEKIGPIEEDEKALEKYEIAVL
jgi:serine/threonine protein kinase